MLTPQYNSNPDTPDFFWMGTWPDAAVMGSGMKEYFEEGKGGAADREFAKIGACRQTSLWWGRRVYGSP